MPWLAAAGLAFVGLPSIAQAQLFPNLPIRRERPPCVQERPDIGFIREHYYGYFPTCWRRFPDGWGCPTAERPDTAAMKRAVREDFEKAQKAGATEAAPEAAPPAEGTPVFPGPTPEGMQPPPEGEMPLPSPEQEDRAPLPLDTTPGRPLNSGLPQGGGSPSAGEPVTPPANTRGTGTDRNPGAPRGANPASPRDLAPRSDAGGGEGGLDAPADVSMAVPDGPPLALLDVGNPSDPGQPGGESAVPVPAPAATAGPAGGMPYPSTPEASVPGTAPSAPSAGYGAFGANGMAPAPVQAPQRRSVIGGLFQNWNRRRR